MLRDIVEKLIREELTGELSPQPDPINGGYKIVIGRSGFVWAGDVTREGNYIVARNAVNIRQWGTTRGLGELAESGATSKTKADAVGTVRLHELAVVAMLDAKERINATT